MSAVRTRDYATVGKSVPRVDAATKVRGEAAFLDDMSLPGMLYGKVLRSRFAHARILSIDTSEAEKLPGVKAVVTGKDLPVIHGESFVDEPFLALGKVRYMGEAVAAVAAVDEVTAEAALDLIRVEYEELPALFDPQEAMKPGAPLIHEAINPYTHPPIIEPVPDSNICNHFQLVAGDVDQGFREADLIFEDTFTTPMQQHCSLETHGTIAQVDTAGKITLWTTNDSPYRCRKEVADALKIPMTHVRVIALYIGGNFGGKGGLKAEPATIALALKVRNRPVKIMFSREEEFTSSLVRHPSVSHIKTGVMKDGRIVARQVTTIWDTGAYAEKGPTVSRLSGVSAAGPYQIPNVKVDGYVVYTNKQVAGACRGYGGPQVCWAYESQMDMIAAKLGMDPLELRLKNGHNEGDIHASGQQLYSVGLKECLGKAAREIGWGQPKAGPYRGKGISFMERAIKTPFASAAFVKVNEDATIEVLSSTTEVGQGSETILCQVAAEELGVPLEWVSKAMPDTTVTPFDASTTSSRSTFHMGNAVRMAAADAKEQILQMAGEVLEASPEDLEVREGRVSVKGVPERGLGIAEVLRRRFGGQATVLGRGFFYPGDPNSAAYFSLDSAFWIYAAQAAEVEVNPKTGQVTVLKLVGAHDAGVAIHPQNCEEQIRGSLAMGLGFTLFENLQVREGKTVNPSFMDYRMPSMLDMPEVVPIVIEMAHEHGPFGAKGVGEPGLVATAPAIANAVYDAVGVRIKDLPITPDKVLAALREKAAQQKG